MVIHTYLKMNTFYERKKYIEKKSYNFVYSNLHSRYVVYIHMSVLFSTSIFHAIRFSIRSIQGLLSLRDEFQRSATKLNHTKFIFIVIF